MQARASCSSDIWTSSRSQPSESLHKYDISLRPDSAQPRLNLELSSLDRMHTWTMFPAATHTIITDPITAIVVYGGWADTLHTNSDIDPREIPQISDKRTLLLGQDPTCADGPISLPLQAQNVLMHPPYGRGIAPCADCGQAWHHPFSYLFWPLVRLRVTKPISLSRAGWPARINLPLWEFDRGGWKQERNFRASIEEPYLSTSAATLSVRFLQPVASQCNATSSEPRKIAWRMYPTTTAHPC